MDLLLAIALAQGRTPDTPLEDLGEIHWLTDADAAVDKAQDEKKLILWYPYAVATSQMERKIVLDNYMKAGPFFSADVVDLIKRKFVPLRAKSSRSFGRDMGVKALDWVEPGLLLVTPDEKVVLKLDRMTSLSEDWLLRILRKAVKEEAPKTARGLLQQRKFDEAMKAAKDDVERGLVALRQDKFDDAAGFFERSDAPEARYYLGAVRHLQNRDVEGRKIWSDLVKDRPKDRWAWKADAEFRGLGPFVRGFEEIGAMPDDVFVDTATSSQRTPSTIPLMTKRAVRFLRVHQRADGSWDDSNYNFGGEDSLPNVYTAITALSALALLEWRDVDPDGVKKALDRATPYLMDEKNTAPKDEDEMIWAHIYRLLYFAELKTDDAKKKMNEIVGLVVKLQQEDGAWRHEYFNPFATASTLQALWVAKQAGAEVPEDAMQKGAKALRSCRSKDGVFSYEHPSEGHFGQVQFSAGRMPLCELALFLTGAAKKETLANAVAVSFEHEKLLERIRKYDNHADAYGNGGFFFWYDQHGLAEALNALKDDAGRRKLRERVLSIGEIDGSWVDSHELGKTYGTAMGLITLKRVEK